MPLPLWDLLIEDSYAAGGAVSASAALTLRRIPYQRLTVTLGRRGPHQIEAVIPFSPEGSSHGLALDQFDAWRELRVERDAVPFLAGLQGAAGVPGGEEGATILLPGYGNAMALTQFYGQAPGTAETVFPSATGDYFTMVRSFVSNASRADNIIGRVLDTCIRGTSYPGTPWFPSGGRTIATGTYTPIRWVASGMSQAEIIQQVCDAEGWEARYGVASDGSWTVAIGGSVNVDRTATVMLDSPGNCRITDYAPDATRLATRVRAAIRNQGPETKVYAFTAAGAASLTIESGAQDRFWPGAYLLIDPGGANEEELEVAYQYGTGEIFVNGTTANDHDAGERIVFHPDLYFVDKTATTAKTSEGRHHRITRVVYNDQVRDVTARQQLATTVMNASDDLFQSVRVRVTDVEYAESLLGLGLHPGDTVTLTSQRLPFSATTLQVQTMTLLIEDGGLTGLDLVLGDPADDALAVLERRYGAARIAASATQ